MIRVDGSYPCSFDSRHGRWEMVKDLSLEEANAILIKVAQEAGEEDFRNDGKGHILINKCFRVYEEWINPRGDGENILRAVYNHDGHYHVIQCPTEEAKNLELWGK